MNAKCFCRRRLTVIFTIIASAALVSASRADTFTNRVTGETFDGYIVKVYRGQNIQVRVGGRARYVDISTYDVERNTRGRKRQVAVFPIKGTVDLMLQAEAFGKAIASAADQGPLFILVEIDTVGQNAAAMRRMADAILGIDHCSVYALLSGEKVGGAFDTAAVIPLACERIYMKSGTSIGAMRTPVAAAGEEIGAGQVPEADWVSYAVSLARRRGRSEALVRAMFDANIEVVEAAGADQTVVVARSEVKPAMQIVRTISERGELLTLGAQEAARLGLANGTAGSQADLMATLGVSDAKGVANNIISKSRVAFDRDMRQIDRVLEIIDARDGRQEEIDAELRQLEVSLNYFQRDFGFGYTPAVADVMAATFARRQDLLLETLDLLAAQVADYQALIEVASKWADLADLTESLEQKVQTDTRKFNDARMRANVF